MPIANFESTTLARATYDEQALILLLEFRSRAIYCYLAVPATIYRELLDAPSKGTYFNRNIRGRFPYKRLLRDEPVGE